MHFSPKTFKRLINLYPPYIGAGIRVEYVSKDWREIRVSMAMRWYNRNAVGTHFGGSLYSMVDPHLMLLLMRLLGRDYLVWDQSAAIDFVKATKKKVTCVIKIGEEDLETIKRQTRNGDKYLARFPLEIRNADAELIARVEKVVYVRRKSRQV